MILRPLDSPETITSPQSSIDAQKGEVGEAITNFLIAIIRR